MTTHTAALDPSLPLLAKGFRPFFLLAALYATVMVPLWLAILTSKIAPDSYLPPMIWHAHEMMWGFVSAVIAGFLLTAVGNWTQRETASGAPLAGLAVLWLVGRLAMLFAGALPRGVPALLDLAFLPTLAWVLARPLVAAKNRRNFVMLAIVTTLFAANLVIHLDALGWLPSGSAHLATLLSLDLVLLLILLIGGRIFPMFTRNRTGVQSIRNVPWLDRLCVAAMTGLLIVDAIMAQGGRLAHPSLAWSDCWLRRVRCIGEHVTQCAIRCSGSCTRVMAGSSLAYCSAAARSWSVRRQRPLRSTH
jgi:uncharacterized protein involved in response to NO